MRVVVQRVAAARVTAAGEVVSEIGRGLLLFVGVGTTDTDAACDAAAKRIAGLRIFDDDAGSQTPGGGRMNRSCEDVGGEFLAVSQFTLLADLSKGKRPGFEPAMKPPEALRLYDAFCEKLAAATGRPVKKGRFGASMKIELVNDGPATFVIDA